MTDYIVTRADESELEHHGVKGQKWGVRRYKQARSQAVSSYSKIHKDMKVQDKAYSKYGESEKKRYKTSAKRDILADKASSAKSGSRKQARLNKKLNKYNRKLNAQSKESASYKKEALGAMSKVAKGQAAYSNAIKKAAKEHVMIKDHTKAKHLLAGTIAIYVGDSNPNLDMFRSRKDAFDEAVMDYRKEIHK